MIFNSLILLIISVLEIPVGADLYALTVFSGSDIDTFHLEYISRIERGGTGGDMILARCKGEYLEYIGVLHGMSGSPVYYEGTLIGALAIAWSDNKEPIAGITPIEDMLREVRYGLQTISMDNSLRDYEIGISVSGFSDISLSYLEDNFSQNYKLVQGGMPEDDFAEIEPGGVLCVQLVSGDASISAIGTVTDVIGDTVIGFGHAFTSSGACELPMSSGFVHVVMPLRTLGFKLASPAGVIGTITSDVSTGVAGIIGRIPEQIDLKVNIRNEKNEFFYTNQYNICRSKNFTPILIPVLTMNSILRTGNYSNEFYIKISTDIFLPNGRTLNLKGSYNSFIQYQYEWLSFIQIVFTVLLENSFDDSYPDSVKVDIIMAESIKELTLSNAFLPVNNVKKGDTLFFNVIFKENQGGYISKSIKVIIPDYFIGDSLGILLTDAVNLPVFNDYKNIAWTRFQNYDQMLDFIDNFPDNEKLYVILYENEIGSDLSGAEISSFPLSILGAMKYSGVNATPVFTNLNILYYEEIPFDAVVKGVVVKRITVQ